MVAAEFDFVLSPGEKPDSEACRELLHEDGKVLIQLPAGPGKECIETFKWLTCKLGKAHEHDSLGTTLWDVKFDPSAGDRPPGRQGLARSLTMNEFPMHTDGAFEDPPPDYIGLYVVQADCLGGGITRLIDSNGFYGKITDKTLKCLKETLFPMAVPQEFNKGEDLVSLAIVTKQGRFRFRDELIVRSQCSQNQLEALAELNYHLSDETLVSSIFLPTGSIMLLDNGRYFHARTPVLDPGRHLLRMRFQGRVAPAVRLEYKRSEGAALCPA